MKITFNINFHTVWGQKLFIVGSTPELGNWNSILAKEMNHLGDGNWQLIIDLPNTSKSIEYKYLLRSNDFLHFEEFNKNHSVIFDKPNEYKLYDSWQILPEDSIYYTSAFTKSIFGNHPTKKVKAVKSKRKVIIKVFAPCIREKQRLAITGNQDCLGNWDSMKALTLTSTNAPEWQIELDGEQLNSTLEYKFVLLDDSTNTSTWELGENRIFTLPPVDGNEVIILSGLHFRNTIPDLKYTGSVIPVFSLRSNKSFGVGDLGDLHLFIDWAKKTDQHLIQILPMNDTTMSKTWKDSYPYSAISIYALHPMYININWLGTLTDKKKQKLYNQKQIELNQKESVDYESVVKYKTAYLLDYFNEKGKSIFDTDEYKAFFTNNESWLMPYAAYSYLRDQNNSSDFTTWGKYAVYNKAEIARLCDKNNKAYEQISFFYFLQYILDTQFKKVAEHARLQGIVLKGDLPIGVNRTSIEAWTEPQYFNMTGQAGAPPDDFSKIGQNWMFPTYNWDVMENDGYAWWKKRFSKLNDYYDCFRIDHILGFFRIWEIPQDYVQGLCGHFNPALAFTKEEIEQYGLPFNKTRFTTPHIHQQYLHELFGDLTDETINYYLAQSSSQYFALKPFCNTQKKIEALFANKTDEQSIHIKNGLFSIANEVLFLRDPHDANKFHPRISANQSYIYRELSDFDKDAFNRLYWTFFYFRNNNFWKEQAEKHLSPLIGSSNMLICGEDLGMIPESVPEVMNKLKILSLEIERMPKSSGQEFTDLKQLPYLSVCTTSTHDMNPLRNWWKEERGKTQYYFNNILKNKGEAPEECTPEIAFQIITNHLASPSMLSIIPLQDWLAIDKQLRRNDIEAERINIPANPNHYWCYRMHITLEDLLKADDFNNRIKKLVRDSGRE